MVFNFAYPVHVASDFSLFRWLVCYIALLPMSTDTVYSNRELRFFRLAKGVVDHSNAALRNVFKREWSYTCTLPRHGRTTEQVVQCYWRKKNRHRVFMIQRTAKTTDTSCGDVEEWDVTTLVFALNYSDALSGIRFGYRWRRINNAIY